MKIELMCPNCQSRNWTLQADNVAFLCDECGETHKVNEMIIGADFYVYRFVNDDWGVPFYVGKGSKARYKSLSGRSEHIKAICSKFNWHTEIVRYFDSEIVAYEYEKRLKEEYKSVGYPIIDGETSIINKLSQRRGIEKAKAQGKYIGRKPVTIPDFDEYYQRYLKREINKTELAKELKISRPTLDKLINEQELVFT